MKPVLPIPEILQSKHVVWAFTIISVKCEKYMIHNCYFGTCCYKGNGQGSVIIFFNKGDKMVK